MATKTLYYKTIKWLQIREFASKRTKFGWVNMKCNTIPLFTDKLLSAHGQMTSHHMTQSAFIWSPSSIVIRLYLSFCPSLQRLLGDHIRFSSARHISTSTAGFFSSNIWVHKTITMQRH